MARKGTNVAVKDDGVPAYLKKMQGNGSAVLQDNFDASDVVVPRIKLLQGTSPEVEAFDHARIGQFWHTGYDEPLGPEFNFVVCSRRKKYLLVAPMEDKQGVLARADDAKTWDRLGEWQVKFKDRREPVTWEIADTDVAKSGLAVWGTSIPDDENSPPAATLFYEYLVICPDRLDLGPAVISITRSGIKKAKKGLNDKIALQANNGRPMQALIFLASSSDERNEDDQPYKNWSFRSNGFASEELYKRAVSVGNDLSDYAVQDEGGAAHEGDAPTGGGKSESDDF